MIAGALLSVIWCFYVVTTKVQERTTDPDGSPRPEKTDEAMESAGIPQVTIGFPMHYEDRPIMRPGRQSEMRQRGVGAGHEDAGKAPVLYGIVTMGNQHRALLGLGGDEGSQTYQVGDAIGHWVVYEITSTEVQLKRGDGGGTLRIPLVP